MRLINHFNADEQKMFMVLESKTCKVHRQPPKISFHNNGIKVKACCNRYEDILNRKIALIQQQIIESRL